jgi:hypothetical protein
LIWPQCYVLISINILPLGKKMKKNFVIISLISFTLFLASCAALEEQAREATCNTNAAYAQGVNDAQARRPMKTNYGAICQGNVPAINNAYKHGYMTMVSSRSDDKGGININIGRGGAHADNQWQCIDLPFKSVCGYGCLQTPFNKAYCGARRGDNCVINDFNQVKCGKHCHAAPMGTTIICDIERYSKSSDKP